MSGAELAGKVAIITGGARGQGAAEGRLFVERGAKVVLTDVLVEEGRATAGSLGPDAVFVAHDVSDEAAWAPVVDATLERWGRLDVLVNNRGSTAYARSSRRAPPPSRSSWRPIWSGP